MENKFSVQLSADDSSLIKTLNNSKNKLETLQKSFEKTATSSNALGGVTKSLEKNLGSLDSVFGGLSSQLEGLSGMFGSFGGGVSSSVSEVLGSLSGLSGGLLAVGAVAVGVISKSISEWDNLKQELNAFQNIAEASDAEMLKFSQSAKELSNQSGIATIEIIKMQQGLIGINPDLVKNTSALNTMSNAVLALSAAGRISSEDAGQYLSSVLAAFNLSGESAVDVSNQIAQASRIGSAEIENVSQILQKSGSAFASAGVDLNMALGVIEGVGDKYLGKSEELGTALNSTLSKLMSVREEYSEYNLSLHSLNDVLEAAAKNHLTYADYVELVGIANASLLSNMVQNRQKFGELAAQIDGTNAAMEMAEVQNNSLGKSWEKLGVVTENFFLSIGQTGVMQQLYQFFQDFIDSCSELVVWWGGLVDQWDNLMSQTKGQINVWSSLGLTWEAIKQTFQALVEIVFVGCAVIVKAYQGIWNNLVDIANWIRSNFSETPIGRAFMASAKQAWEWIKKLFDGIKKAWDDLKRYLGLKNGGSTDVKVDVKENKTITETYKGGGSGLPSIKKGGGKKGGSKKGGHKTEIAPPEIGSLAYYEQRLRGINDELSRTIPNAGRLQELKMEAHVLEEQIAKIKKRNALHDKVNVTKEKPTIEKGSIQEISDLISSKESQIKTLRVGSDSFNLLRDEIEKLKADKELLELSLHPKVDENSMNSLLGSLQKVQEQINGLKTSISVTTDKTELDSLSEQLKFLTDKEHKIQLSIDEKRQENAKNAIEETRQEFENLGDITNNVGSIFSNLGKVTNDSFLSMVGAVSSGISQMLPQISALIQAQKAQALGGIISSNANLGLLSFGLIASGVALVTSLFDSLPKFENGGIVGSVVGGNSFHGDKILARLNSGELVLNKNQQTRLYNTLQQGQSTSSAPMGGAVQFKISGRDLVGVLSNHQNKTSRVL
jgi:phage tail tape measure protein, TP901 family|nr:MAG TPA: Putative tail length tape measure protein [Caudoviricetes sp.]